jgi:nucleoside-diphosphate-sugar epimerase
MLIDNMMTQRYCSLFNLPKNGVYRLVEADVLKVDMRPLLVGTECVLHLAAITDAAGSFQNREQVEHVNYNATVRVAEACREAKVPMIHLSSTSVYGTQKEIVDELCTEDDLKPQSPYAETKLREEKYLQEVGVKGGLQFVICRFGTICGISQGMRFHTAVNKFCWQAAMGQPLTVWRTAYHQKRPYLALEDASEALMHIIERRMYDGNIYNVLTANLTVCGIIEGIRKHIDDVTVQYVDTEIMNQLSYEVSNARFREKGFQYCGDISKCIDETISLLSTGRMQ